MAMLRARRQSGPMRALSGAFTGLLIAALAPNAFADDAGTVNLPDGLDFNASKASGADGNAATVKYRLPNNVWKLYPFKWLPAPYKHKYRELSATIEHFTEQSLRRGGVDFKEVHADVQTQPREVRVKITGGDRRILRRFAVVHHRFFDKNHALQGKRGVQKCKNTSGCWDPKPGDKPWAFFLPVGLPLIGQEAVTLLDYPPSDSLMKRDYLGNFTMDRWSRVLGTVGIDHPKRYEAIVDSRPIAAPGSGQSQYMPAVSTYFNDPPDGPTYVVPMLKLLSRAATHTPEMPRPVLVLGDPARKAWGNIIGKNGAVSVLEVGRTPLDKHSKRVPWVASNHPDVATYQCCPGDPSPHCQEKRDQHLPKMTRIDLQAACIVRTMARNPSKKPAAIKKMCHTRWVESPSQKRERKFCVLARLGYNFSAKGRPCQSKKQAERFCARYNNNPCPKNVYKCKTSSE